MRVVRTAQELHYPAGAHVALVPTMGAFHEGHLELMRRAKADGAYCVVSLFVNPTQFGAGEDFERYPRDEDSDFAMAESVGVDVMFAPTTEGVYRRNTTTVSVRDVTRRWEGESRPGHFDGVATVVCKLFHMIRPSVAYFGTKDYQQCLVIRRMVEDLDMSVELRLIDTVREPDGLAMSSRNRMLDPGHRARAPMLYRTLCNARDELITKGTAGVVEVLNRRQNELQESGFAVEYFAFVDASTLEPKIDSGEGRLIVAARLGETRLIDNLAVPVAGNGV